MDLKTRLKNYAMWIAVVSLIVLTTQLEQTSIPYLSVLLENEEWVTKVMLVLVLLGIVNNPTTDNNGFSDDADE